MIFLLNNHHLIVKVYWTLDGQEVYFVGIVPKSNQSNLSDQDYVIKMRKPQIQSTVPNEENVRSTLYDNN